EDRPLQPGGDEDEHRRDRGQLSDSSVEAGSGDNPRVRATATLAAAISPTLASTAAQIRRSARRRLPSGGPPAPRSRLGGPAGAVVTRRRACLAGPIRVLHVRSLLPLTTAGPERRSAASGRRRLPPAGGRSP